MRNILPWIAAGVLLASAPQIAAASTRVHPVNFAKGASNAVVQGVVKGYDTVDYQLRANEGQSFSVSMQASHPSAYFNVLPPGSTDAAIHIGSSAGNDWTGKLDAGGTYTVRVYLMRSAARRGTTARFTLRFAIQQAIASSVDALVPGTHYHATGRVACKVGNEPERQCDFGVVRNGGGRAEVVVTLPGGRARKLVFSAPDVSAADAHAVRATRQGDGWAVDVDATEHYLIPDAVIEGG